MMAQQGGGGSQDPRTELERELQNTAGAISGSLQEAARSMAESLRETTAESVQRFAESVRGGLSDAAQSEQPSAQRDASRVRSGHGTARVRVTTVPFSRRTLGEQPFSQRSFSQQIPLESAYVPGQQTYRSYIANSSWARGAVGVVRAVKRILAWVMGVAGVGSALLWGLMGAINLVALGNLTEGLLLLSFAAVSGVLSYLGFGAAKRMRRFTAYLGVLGDSDWCSVEDLAQAVQKSPAFVVHDVRKMIRMGYFRAAFLPPDGSLLFESGKAYREYLEQHPEAAAGASAAQADGEAYARAAARASQHKDAAAAPRTPQTECEAFLTELRTQKARIQDPAVLEQVEGVEQHTQRIISWVQAHPGCDSAVRRFAGYYLPTTLKLLRTYNEVDAQADDSTVAGQIQTDIVGILYTINKAFSNLEDNLLQDTAMDVSAEISALETVLAQEGLTESGIQMK